MYFTENENKNSKLKFSKCIKNINSKRIDSNDMSNMISLTHKCLEANFSHKKTNLLQDIIKINEKNKESNLLYVKNFFLNGNNNLAYLPNFAKKKQISYLNTNKDFSKAKNLIIKNVVSKRKKDVLRKVILENLKIQS